MSACTAMLFNSIDFALFLPVVFGLYWAVPAKRRRLRNWILLLASYVFYGWWDWRFLSLILASSLVDFFVGIQIERSRSDFARKVALGVSFLMNLGLLGAFKYFDFFAQSFNEAFSMLGVPLRLPYAHLVLPVGISFYTFQTLSYSIDVYRRRLRASRNLVSFLAYVAFFPQLVAGPIERASNLLPQFEAHPPFSPEKAVQGLRQILWGAMKKMVIADGCASAVNDIYVNYDHLSGLTLWAGALLFAFQIYGDFSGYSDMAIGTAKLFGFDLMQNFAYPYFSRDIAEFWRRWHISLSTWFRDYLYIPLGGSRGGRWSQIRNTFVIFLVSGLWHGANWTFVLWGLLHALFFLPLLLFSRNRSHTGPISPDSLLPSFGDAIRIIGTFLLVCVAWVFFRAESLAQAVNYLGRMFDIHLMNGPIEHVPGRVVLFILLMLAFEWRGRMLPFALHELSWSRPIRWGCYLALSFSVLFLSAGSQGFIYFQF